MNATMPLNKLLPYLAVILVFYSCFKEDTPIDPVSRNGIRISGNMYHYQSFYDLSTDAIQTNPNNKWDLAFENGTAGWRIRINYSNFLGIYRTGSFNFLETSYPVTDKNWIYDASSGNPDSTAIGNWKEVMGEGHQVYLLGSYDGVRYKPFKKLKFLEVTDTSYSFSYSNLDNSDSATVTIKKMNEYNYTYYSLHTKDTVIVEPQKENWDILFTQYTTTLYTNEGVPTPYIVRGIYLNPFNVAAALDTTTGYPNITTANVSSFQLSVVQDVIGYDWKSVEINQSANTARYTVRQNHSYIIRDTEGSLYKLHFLSYVNDSLLVGYPLFEKERL